MRTVTMPLAQQLNIAFGQSKMEKLEAHTMWCTFRCNKLRAFHKEDLLFLVFFYAFARQIFLLD